MAITKSKCPYCKQYFICNLEQSDYDLHYKMKVASGWFHCWCADLRSDHSYHPITVAIRDMIMCKTCKKCLTKPLKSRYKFKVRCVLCSSKEGKKPEGFNEGYPICDKCALRMAHRLLSKQEDKLGGEK